MIVLGIILAIVFLPELVSGFFGTIGTILAAIGGIIGSIFRIFE